VTINKINKYKCKIKVNAKEKIKKKKKRDAKGGGAVVKETAVLGSRRREGCMSGLPRLDMGRWLTNFTDLIWEMAI